MVPIVKALSNEIIFFIEQCLFETNKRQNEQNTWKTIVLDFSSEVFW